MKFSVAFLSLYLASSLADKDDSRNLESPVICKSGLPNPSKAMKQLFRMAGTEFKAEEMHTIGSITALIPEAADAAISGANVADGESGDTDFPFGNFKPLATVGEFSQCKGTRGEMIVGVPDGIGSYLVDRQTLRVITQSESYGPLAAESYPFPVNDGIATFTGSHVQYVDYDRWRLSNFMSKDRPASDMVKGMGEVITKAYNLKGELVGPRNPDGPTAYGAHFSNTDAEGNYVVVAKPGQADWLMQSLCSAHLEVKHQWGEGIGLEDDTFITNEEWNSYAAGVDFVGLSSHAIDLATGSDWAIGAMTNGGFEKVVEINSLHKDYVVLSPSGYNGNFGSYDQVIAKRNAEYTRNIGGDYAQPQDIVPARVYIGVKGKMEDGSPAPADDYLARNGLRYGKNYGFATDMSADGPTHGLWRDEFHKNSTLGVNGAKVPGKFTPIEWQWTGEVKNFQHDGAWEFQDEPPMHPSSDILFWNAKGNDAGGCKCEHNSPDPRVGKSGFVQGSTCGYFGHYYLNDLKEVLDAAGGDLPGDIDATYFVYQGETDITSQIILGGKGQYASYKEDGADATMNFDSTSAFKKTFEDIDGLEIIEGPGEKLYAVIQEDSGNDYGERMFVTNVLEHNGTPVTYYFAAMSGGNANTRMLAGVGIPAGVNTRADAHEFSGVADMSGLLARDSDNKWIVSADDEGHAKRAADRGVALNDKLLLIGLQAHNFNGGVIADYGADRGGQWLAFQPFIPGL